MPEGDSSSHEVCKTSRPRPCRAFQSVVQSVDLILTKPLEISNWVEWFSLCFFCCWWLVWFGFLSVWLQCRNLDWRECWWPNVEAGAQLVNSTTVKAAMTWMAEWSRHVFWSQKQESMMGFMQRCKEKEKITHFHIKDDSWWLKQLDKWWLHWLQCGWRGGRNTEPVKEGIAQERLKLPSFSPLNLYVQKLVYLASLTLTSFSKSLLPFHLQSTTWLIMYSCLNSMSPLPIHLLFPH